MANLRRQRRPVFRREEGNAFLWVLLITASSCPFRKKLDFISRLSLGSSKWDMGAVPDPRQREDTAWRLKFTSFHEDDSVCMPFSLSTPALPGKCKYTFRIPWSSLDQLAFIQHIPIHLSSSLYQSGPKLHSSLQHKGKWPLGLWLINYITAPTVRYISYLLTHYIQHTHTFVCARLQVKLDSDLLVVFLSYLFIFLLLFSFPLPSLFAPISSNISPMNWFLSFVISCICILESTTSIFDCLLNLAPWNFVEMLTS